MSEENKALARRFLEAQAKGDMEALDELVDAAAMHAASHAFYQAANGVWLTDHVPPGDLSGWPG